MSRKPRFEALVVNAIRRLQAAQGSTAAEIANYLNQEHNVGGADVRKLIQQTIRRGLNYGILHKLKRGYVTCDRNIPELLEPLDIADCGSCKKRKPRRKSCKKKKRSKRRGCRSGCKRADVNTREAARCRKVVRKQRTASSNDNSMKNQGGESTSDGRETRQSIRNRQESKSPMRNTDETPDT